MQQRSQAIADSLVCIEEALLAALAHPLSSRKTLLVAVLLDNFCDEIFAALRQDAPARVFLAEDVLAFRDRLGKEEPALRLVFELCASVPSGPRLETRAIEVPIEAYGALSLEDFMVSLYNANTVQRVAIVAENGRVSIAHDVLDRAIAYLKGIVPPRTPS